MLSIFDDFGDQKIQETPQKNCKNAKKLHFYSFFGGFLDFLVTKVIKNA